MFHQQEAEEFPPSARYLSIILEGARRERLKEEYLRMLEEHPTYSPPEWVLKVRRSRPNLEEFPPVTVEELAKHKEDEDSW